jgi:hypothetical protein
LSSRPERSVVERSAVSAKFSHSLKTPFTFLTLTARLKRLRNYAKKSPEGTTECSPGRQSWVTYTSYEESLGNLFGLFPQPLRSCPNTKRSSSRDLQIRASYTKSILSRSKISGREDNAAAAFQSTALTCSAKQKKNQSPSDDTWIGRIKARPDEPTAVSCLTLRIGAANVRR